jgi:hypothetical protein
MSRFKRMSETVGILTRLAAFAAAFDAALLAAFAAALVAALPAALDAALFAAFAAAVEAAWPPSDDSRVTFRFADVPPISCTAGLNALVDGVTSLPALETLLCGEAPGPVIVLWLDDSFLLSSIEALLVLVFVRLPGRLASLAAHPSSPSGHRLVDEPLLDEPLLDEPLLDEPLLDEPLLDEPLLDEPLLDEPLLDEPISDAMGVRFPAATWFNCAIVKVTLPLLLVTVTVPLAFIVTVATWPFGRLTVALLLETETVAGPLGVETVTGTLEPAVAALLVASIIWLTAADAAADAAAPATEAAT